MFLRSLSLKMPRFGPTHTGILNSNPVHIIFVHFASRSIDRFCNGIVYHTNKNTWQLRLMVVTTLINKGKCLLHTEDGHYSTVLNNRNLLTYLLTPWSRVLLEKLTGSAASQEIPRIFGTRRFITVFTSARHLSLS